MEAESESESVDIASIQMRALAPWPGLGRGGVGGALAAAAGPPMHANGAMQTAAQGSRQQGNAASTALSSHLSHSASGQHDGCVADPVDTSALASTVLESADIHAVLQSLPPHALQHIAKRMSSQNDATQELSPSQLDRLISKSRSAVVGDAETQHTLTEGDEGHIDITSSFVPPDDSGDDEAQAQVEESQPLEFSPTQTQSKLPYFPESQRFKTPATAGKKRQYTGHTKETPDLPRPDLRNGEPTPTHLLALSQAFAATQAATSPFLNGIANPLSDRPSPALDVQVRPATATTPSPMRPISEFRRATTEPASRYVPVAQSQAERNRRALLNLPDDDSDDAFSDEPSLIQEKRRQREREEKLKEHFRTISSPTRRLARPGSAVKSSPVLPAPRSSPSPVSYSGQLSPQPPVQRSVIDDVDISEAETEKEDESDHTQRISDPIIDDEDKENDERMVQIPRTTVRLQRLMNDLPSQVEQSPSLRYRDHHEESFPPVAVANSQPSQPFTRSQRMQPKSSSHSGVDFVPQSQAEPSTGTVKQGRLASKDRRRESEERFSGSEEEAERQHSSAPAQLGGTIPETSSSRQAGQSAPLVADQSIVSRSMSNSNFETAPSRLPLPSSSRSKLLEMSSPPIDTRPPGRKRKRLTDISASSSPKQSTQGFDPVVALDNDPEVLSVLSQSPVQTRIKRRKTQPPIRQVLESHPIPRSQSPKPPQDTPTEEHQHLSDVADEQIVMPQRPTTTQRSSLRRPKLVGAVQNRASVWDVEVSPQKATSPVSQEPVQQMQTRRSLRKPGGTPIEPQQRILDDHVSGVVTDHHSNEVKQRTKTRQTVKRNRQSRGESESPSNDIGETGSMIVAVPTQSAITTALPQDTMPPKSSRSNPADDILAPDMVFACFNGKTRAYYPARCLERIESEPIRYRIQWENYEPDEVDAYGVKAVDVRVGDLVKIDMKGFAKVPYVVRGFKDKGLAESLVSQMTDIRGFRTVLVAPKQRKSLPAEISTETVREAPIAAIYLDNNMWNQMRNRSFRFHPQVSRSISTSGYATPLEASSTPSTPTSRSKRQSVNMFPSGVPLTDGIFSNMAFAISYDDPARKNAIVDLVRNNGGTLVRESFTELFQTDSIDLKPQYGTIGFTALLADKLSRKEKYMQALALGLPCLSGKWIEACISSTEAVEWQTYLLPAGEADALDGAVRSRVMPQMNATSVRLADMLQSRPCPLKDARVAVVVGRGKAEAKRKPYLFLIQALGACAIEKVADLKAAKDLVASGDVDWMFVDDREVDAAQSELDATATECNTCKVAGNELIVQSLILGKLFDMN